MLTLTLRGLERDGLVTRTVFPTIPPRVDYELTALGRDLLEPVSTLGEWAIRNQPKIARAREQFDGIAKKPSPARPRAAAGTTSDRACPSRPQKLEAATETSRQPSVFSGSCSKPAGHHPLGDFGLFLG